MPKWTTFESQADLLESLVEVVLKHAPEDWEWAHLEVSLITEAWSGLVIVSAGGHQLSGPITEGKVLSILRRLRHKMYEPGTGTWYSMTLDITPDSAPETTFDYDTQPHFDEPPSSEAYLHDLMRYRRKDSSFPDWLVPIVAESRKGGDSAADSFTRWLKGGV